MLRLPTWRGKQASLRRWAGPIPIVGFLGMGVVEEGQIGVVAGTTTPVQIKNRPRRRSRNAYLDFGYLRSGKRHRIKPSLSGGFPRSCPSSPPGGRSGWLGARRERDALHNRGGGFNASALEPPVDNLTFSSVIARAGEGGSADVARAVLEGMAYAVRANIEQIRQVSGVNKSGVFIGGDISRSALWTGMISNILGEPVKVSYSSEATALGAAICAGLAAGVFKDLVSGSKSLVCYSREQAPEEDLSETYQSLYREWQTLRRERRPADEIAAGQITGAMLAGGALEEEGGSRRSSDPGSTLARKWMKKPAPGCRSWGM